MLILRLFVLIGCILCLPAGLSASSSTHVLLYGDAGAGNSGQYRVGEGMGTIHARAPFNYAVSMGDNMYVPYREGIFADVFENPYKKLIESGVPFFQALGNHDMEDDRLEKQLAYSREQNVIERGVGGWVLPAEDYLIEQPGARWVVLNVSTSDGKVNWTNERETFLTSVVCSEFSGWTFVVVHYPLWSTNAHGDNPSLQRRLLPILSECAVDMVFSGHDHHAEYILPWDWTPFLTIGNGHEFRDYKRSSDRESLFSFRGLGFGGIRFDDSAAQVTLYNERGQGLYEFVWQRRVPAWVDVWKEDDKQVLSRVEWPDMDHTMLDVEVGFSSREVNPLMVPEEFVFEKAEVVGRFRSPEGFVYAADIPRRQGHRYAVTRVRLKGKSDDRWIYGDMSQGEGHHGNYDGIQASNLLPIRTR
jgi:hypothetical protein